MSQSPCKSQHFVETWTWDWSPSCARARQYPGDQCGTPSPRSWRLVSEIFRKCFLKLSDNVFSLERGKLPRQGLCLPVLLRFLLTIIPSPLTKLRDHFTEFIYLILPTNLYILWRLTKILTLQPLQLTPIRGWLRTCCCQVSPLTSLPGCLAAQSPHQGPTQ